MSLLGIVPARGGSKGLKGKNLALVAGRPLFLHAAQALEKLCDRVVVSTDSDRIAAVARLHGFQVHRRPEVSDEETVIDVARLVVDSQGDHRGCLLLQPTVPPTFNLVAWLESARQHDSAVAGKKPGHIVWGTPNESPLRRVNRQQAGDWPLQEVGLYWWRHEIREPHTIIPVQGDAFDIDTAADLEEVRRWYGRKTILLRYVADETRGTGHIRRMLTLAEALQHHRIFFQAADEPSWDATYLDVAMAGWEVHAWGANVPADLVLTDALDTSTSPIANNAPWGTRWVTFEDRGSISHLSDLTINALYGRQGWLNERTGPDWAILRPEFAGLPPFQVTDKGRVLVMFGGTDPARLEKLASSALYNATGVTEYSVPDASESIPELMHTNDLLITSAGRTVYEAAAVGIPSIVLAQNNREATHVHLGSMHGNIYLGLGRLVTVEKLRHTIEQLLADRELRTELSVTARRSIDGKGLDRVVAEIERILEGR